MHCLSFLVRSMWESSRGGRWPPCLTPVTMLDAVSACWSSGCSGCHTMSWTTYVRVCALVLAGLTGPSQPCTPLRPDPNTFSPAQKSYLFESAFMGTVSDSAGPINSLPAGWNFHNFAGTILKQTSRKCMYMLGRYFPIHFEDKPPLI